MLSGRPKPFRTIPARRIRLESDYTLRELEQRIDALKATANNPFLPREGRYNASLEIMSIRRTLNQFLKQL